MHIALHRSDADQIGSLTADKIFDETADKVIESQNAELDQPSDGHPSIHGADQRIEQLQLLAEEFGYVGPNAVSIQELPYKIAEALGIKQEDDLGYRKTWGDLATDVVDQSYIREVEERGPMYDRGPHEPRLD